MAAALVGACWPAAAVARDLPPAAPAPAAPNLPVPARRVLPNGMEIMVIERHDLPFVSLHLVIKSGAAEEIAVPAGTAQFVASMLDQGTRTRTAREIAATIDGIGGTIDSNADFDDSSLDLSVLAPDTELAFDLTADMAMHPTFPPAQVERMRKRTLSALDVLRDDPAYVADAVFDSLVLSGTPYARSSDGTVNSVRRITTNDLWQYYNTHYFAGNAILAVDGDVTPERAFSLAAKYFGSWELRKPPALGGGAVEMGFGGQLSNPQQIIVIDKPDAIQTQIRIGNRGVSRADPDYYALSIANQILGGPASNRLFSTLRSERGLTYGASSDLTCYRAAGVWEAKTSTRTAETVKTVELVLQQMKRLRDHPISGEEIEMAQDYLIGHEALDFETMDQIADKFLDLAIDGLPDDTWNRFAGRVRAISTRDVWDATRRRLNPASAVIVLVGDASGFAKSLNKLGAVRVIPLQDLELSAPKLTRSGSAP